MPSNIDFDVRDSDLSVGLEVEYPISDGEHLVSRGTPSNPLLDAIDTWPSPIGGRAVYDGTVGLEVVSDVLPIEDAESWYGDVISFIEAEYNDRFEPTGLMSDGSTAGLHIHISEISRDTAQDLADISCEPWAQVLFCSSIARNSNGSLQWPVFRGGRYCDLQFGAGHYHVVNERGGGHYEWRLPEPVLPEHVGMIMRFLALFVEDRETAIQYAQEKLDAVDDRITAIRRAEAVGMDLDDRPTVAREPFESDPESFYDEVSATWDAPEIYAVELRDTPFYVFDYDTRFAGSSCEIAGVEFTPSDVLYADSLEQVTDAELADDVRSAYRRDGQNPRETEATEELKKLVKKKK